MASAERPTDDEPRPRHEVSLRSRDPVEATAIAARVYHEHRLTIVGDRRAFAMSLDAASLGPNRRQAANRLLPMRRRSVGKVFDETGKLLDPAFIRRIDKFLGELLWMATTLRYGRENVLVH